jgi:F-type H+-transporting ATPase subunit epsilon
MLRVNIVTPERPFLDQECVSVTVPGVMGEMQILGGHAAILAELKAGLMSFQKSDQEIERFMIGEGFVEVDHDQVNILCEQARHKGEVDKDQEESLFLELKEKISKLDEDDAEQKRYLAALSRCVARLSLFE